MCCKTTPSIEGWQQTTTIGVTARAIRRHHCRWFRRLIIIALSCSGSTLLRSSTLLLSPTRRFHCSRHCSRTTITTTTTNSTVATSPSDIHDSYLPLLPFYWKKTNQIFLSKSKFTNYTTANEYQLDNPFFFLLFVILIQQPFLIGKHVDKSKK